MYVCMYVLDDREGGSDVYVGETKIEYHMCFDLQLQWEMKELGEIYLETPAVFSILAHPPRPSSPR